MRSNFLVLLMFSLLVGCNGQNAEKSNPKEVMTENKTVQVSREWTEDKNGCLKIRDEKLAKKLIEENNLRSKVKGDFLIVFGTPNSTENINDGEVLIYYFDCVCRNDELVEGGDKCYAKFHFEKDKLKSEEFICE